MPIQKISVGIDPPRTAYNKINQNYDWLASKIGASDEGISPAGDISGRFLDMTGVTNVYEDLRFEIATLNPTGVGSPATLVATSGQSGIDMALRFTLNNTLYVPVQMSHHWIPGTVIHPHIHIQPQLNGANTIQWNGWYSVADENGVFALSTAFGPFNTNIPAGSQWKHLIMQMPPGGIDLAAQAGPSTLIRLKYQVTAATNPFDVLSFDVHYRWGGSPVIYAP